MSHAYQAYGVYWVPDARDPLKHFGCRWTGWCAEEGRHMPVSEWAGFPNGPASITVELRRHGLHGALWGPFALRDGASTFTLEHLVGAVADASPACRLPAFEAGVVAGRVALIPTTRNPDVCRLMARLARGLDPLRAMSASSALPEHAFGSGSATCREQGLCVPLTDTLPGAEARALLPRIAEIVAPFLDHSRELSELCLMGDPGGGRPLRIIERLHLAGRHASGECSALPCRGRDPGFHGGGGASY